MSTGTTKSLPWGRRTDGTSNLAGVIPGDVGTSTLYRPHAARASRRCPCSVNLARLTRSSAPFCCREFGMAVCTRKSTHI